MHTPEKVLRLSIVRYIPGFISWIHFIALSVQHSGVWFGVGIVNLFPHIFLVEVLYSKVLLC